MPDHWHPCPTGMIYLARLHNAFDIEKILPWPYWQGLGEGGGISFRTVSRRLKSCEFGSPTDELHFLLSFALSI